MRYLRRSRLLRTPNGIAGAVLLLLLLAIAFLGPLFAPHSPTEAIGAPGELPSGHSIFGTDFLGRDVLSRVLSGGHSVFLLAGAATAAAYLAGLTVGLVAGYSRNLLDPILMRGVDILLAFPALLVMLLLASGLGPQVWVLVLGVVLVELPGISRIVRSATQEVSTREFVEAAVARGERTPAVLLREVLPNISSVVLADFGLRFGWSVILIASMNFLGLGLKPPQADWGLMVSENRDYISVNAWSVLVPGVLLALLTISVNLLSDAYARTLGTSLTDTSPIVVAVPGAVDIEIAKP
jgi:peptide/nickel transport system permease protein